MSIGYKPEYAHYVRIRMSSCHTNSIFCVRKEYALGEKRRAPGDMDITPLLGRGNAL